MLLSVIFMLRVFNRPQFLPSHSNIRCPEQLLQLCIDSSVNLPTKILDTLSFGIPTGKPRHEAECFSFLSFYQL